MVVSQIRGTPIKTPPNGIVLVMGGCPNKVPLILGNPHIGIAKQEG